MKKKRGDTLIEVALAIGIFSMIAIIVVSVVAASTSGAQSSLELTLTREELDAQAEALRFIHDSYVSGSQSKDTTATAPDNKYAKIWEAIKGLASSEGSVDLKYNPETCDELYDGNTGDMNLNYPANKGFKPFVINTRLIDYNACFTDPLGASGCSSSPIIHTANSNTRKVFYPPSTYPRFLYGSTDMDLSLLDQNRHSIGSQIYRVEGIYIVATKGNSNVVDASNPDAATVSSKTAYYDFYIRSCWMPVNSDRASTISTVIRLYEPEVVTY
ncbi:type II secretion system protein [Candidatus Saccharibacteria bacterium]|nr:type II secretion system protein [Candidatus Saccharibacteria bacterium]